MAKQIEHVRKQYKKLSSVVKKQSIEIDERTTKRKDFVVSPVSVFSNLEQRLENRIFIDSTITFDADIGAVTNQRIEQSFGDAPSADDLIEVLLERDKRHLFITITTLPNRNTREQTLNASLYRSIERQSYQNY